MIVRTTLLKGQQESTKVDSIDYLNMRDEMLNYCVSRHVDIETFNTSLNKNENLTEFETINKNRK